MLVGNLGISNEWTPVSSWFLFCNSSVVEVRGIECGRQELLQSCMQWGSPIRRSPAPSGAALCPLGNGKTMLMENQITFDAVDQPAGFGISSILAFSLDDLAVSDNQCESRQRIISFTWMRPCWAAVSVWSTIAFGDMDARCVLGVFHRGMNTTVDNQARTAPCACNLPVCSWSRTICFCARLLPDACGRFMAMSNQ